MSILDITEDKIFATLGKGRDPSYKPIDKSKFTINAGKFDYSKLNK